MLCLEPIMARWRDRGERKAMDDNKRARSRSLCSAAAENNLLQVLQRRASSAFSSASELITRRSVFSRRQYGSVEQVSKASGSSDGGSDGLTRRYRLENGYSLGERDELFGPHNAPLVENPEFETRWYFKYFLGKIHQNYLGLDNSREPYLLSVVQEGNAGLLRAVLFNKQGAHKIYIPPSAWASGQKNQTPIRPTVKQILSLFPSMEKVDKLPREIGSAELQKDILVLEEQEGTVNFKMGVVFMKSGQETDDEMLSNEFGDEKWDRFIALLGDTVRLKGWARFRGGLDVKGDMTGQYSVFTIHQGHEIMFHVSTMLPYSKENKQQLERKRHIGNDIVNIIFADPSVHETFNPQWIKSHFTHIFAIVSEVPNGYMLSIYSDESVPPFGPSLPYPPVFCDAQLFRDFLLVKLMNGEKAVFLAPTFGLKRQRTLESLIRDIYSEHCDKAPMLSRRALSDVWSNSSSGSGSGTGTSNGSGSGSGSGSASGTGKGKGKGIGKGSGKSSGKGSGSVSGIGSGSGSGDCSGSASSSGIGKGSGSGSGSGSGKGTNSGNDNADDTGPSRVERFLNFGQAIKLDAVLRGDAPTGLASSGQSQPRRVPWEGYVWRSTPLPGTPLCAEQIADTKLLLSTNSNTYILEECGTTRVILRWEGSVHDARVTERAGLFRVGKRAHASGSLSSDAGSVGVYAVPAGELYAGAWAMRPLQDCKQARLSRTKTAHLFDLINHGGRITLAVAVGRRVLLMAEEDKTDNENGFDYVHIKDIVLSEVPSTITYLDCITGIIVAGFKHHWEVINCINSQTMKRATTAEERRGTLVSALRIGDERDRQLILCYNHTCHFERMTSRGLESDADFDFHWTTVPTIVLNLFPYIMAFAEDLMEIRLVANGSLVHVACIPGLKLLCGRRDIFYVGCPPEPLVLNDQDPCAGLPPECHEKIRQRQGPYSVDEDERGSRYSAGSSGEVSSSTRPDGASGSSCGSSMASEHEHIRPPLQRMAPVSPPNSPQPKATEGAPRTLRVYKIPQANMSAGAGQRPSVTVDRPAPSEPERPSSIRERLAEMNLDNKKARPGCSKDQSM